MNPVGTVNSKQITRRRFVKATAIGAAATYVAPNVVRGAEADRPLTIGLVGAGSRGTYAAKDAMTIDKNVKLVAVADVYANQIERCRETLKDLTTIEDKNCFLGFDAYRKVLETDVDYVIFATPPYYRPDHFAACVEAGKHTFIEKPVAVDPVGIRKIMVAGRQADEKGLCVAAGTQRRHDRSYRATIKRIRAGAIGKIVSAQCYWSMGGMRAKKREPGWSDMEWMHRDWFNWRWLSGDHIVEQHVHNLDVINWAIGTHPEKVVSFGGRARRVNGDQFDYFSSDFTYPDHVHVHSMCRQVHGCHHEVHERVIGQVGVSNCNGWISNFGEISHSGGNPYQLEHADLIKGIRTGERINEAQQVAESTLCAIMARTSAYTGKEVTWDEMMKSDLKLTPPDYELTEANIRAHVPVPGEASKG